MRAIFVQIPNILTGIRIALIPVIIYLLRSGQHSQALMVFIIAALTDTLDGLIARLGRIISPLGTFLDPLADKLLLNATYTVLALDGWLPMWLAAVVWLRDLIIVLGAAGLHLKGRRWQVKPALVGKATTLFQIITVGLFFQVPVTRLFISWQPFLVAVTVVLTLWSGLYYVAAGLNILRGVSGPGK